MVLYSTDYLVNFTFRLLAGNIKRIFKKEARYDNIYGNKIEKKKPEKLNIVEIVNSEKISER